MRCLDSGVCPDRAAEVVIGAEAVSSRVNTEPIVSCGLIRGDDLRVRDQ
jgi:hypothetical protein